MRNEIDINELREKLSQHRGGVGLAEILFVIFLTLKLTGTITWSWWWVTAPLWIPVCALLVIGLLIGVALAIAEVSS